MLKHILLASLLIGLQVQAEEFHVSMSGRDSNPGNLAAPFASLEQARNAARASRRKDPQSAITIWLHAGEYRRDKTLELGMQDSGSAAAPLVIAAAPNERVTLSGATSLPSASFQLLKDESVRARIIDPSARGKVRVVNLKALGITDYGEPSRHGYGEFQRLAKLPPVHLYANGQRQMLARWPNPQDDYSRLLSPLNKLRRGVVARSAIIDPGPGKEDADFDKRGGSFQVGFDRIHHWSQAEDIWLSGIFSKSWEWSYNRVAKLDPEKRQITLAYGEIDGLNNTWVGDYFFAENLLEELDLPGEWFLDRGRGLLYLLPPDDWDQVAPKIELATLGAPMFRLRGADHVIFRDLILEHGRDWAVIVEGGDGIRIEGSEIRHFSNGGIRMTGFRHGISASHLHALGGSAIVLSCGVKMRLSPGECYAEDNVIHDWGWYRKANTGAVNLDGVAQRVAHNHIHHAPQGAIHVGGNDHVIEYNDFHDLLLEFIDMGIVYGNSGKKPLERGHVVRRNYFHDFGQKHTGQFAVYPDNLVQGWTIEENLFARIGNDDIPHPGNHAIHINSADYITVRHNIFIDCPQPVVFSDYAAINVLPRFKPIWNQEIPPQTVANLPHIRRYPELARFWNEDHAKPAHTRYERNLVWNPNLTQKKNRQHRTEAPFLDGAQDQLGTLQRSGNWQMGGMLPALNPGFIDPTNGNYRIKPDSELDKHIPNFPGFDLSEVGPRNKRTGSPPK